MAARKITAHSAMRIPRPTFSAVIIVQMRASGCDLART
jgi:hypothetical protein